MSRESGDGLPTGEQPGLAHDVSDPHPSPDKADADHPSDGGKPAKGPDIGPNSYAHDGKAPPRPKTRG